MFEKRRLFSGERALKTPTMESLVMPWIVNAGVDAKAGLKTAAAGAAIGEGE